VINGEESFKADHEKRVTFQERCSVLSRGTRRCYLTSMADDRPALWKCWMFFASQRY